MFATDDTIVAVATPPGHGGIGVVRLSGPEAHDIACRLLDRRRPLVPRHATFARVFDHRRTDRPADGQVAAPESRPFDQVVVTLFAAPQSYTTEDVVEISAHGSPALLERLLALAIAAGARLAEPGEFTLRAYHDKALSFGSPPVRYVRQQMLNLPIE